mmetsp:Transcript_20649/g.29646  ORF Transcript_20649/g.29646 Transcript_20649/m.29646 type:complete len:82 (-) Transcript_20649:26-271(-)
MTLEYLRLYMHMGEYLCVEYNQETLMSVSRHMESIRNTQTTLRNKKTVTDELCEFKESLTCSPVVRVPCKRKHKASAGTLT